MEKTEQKNVPHLKAWGDWLVMFQDLDNAQFGRLMRTAISYVCAGEEPDMSEWAKEDRLSFNILRPVLDKNRKNYLDKVRKNTENGAKGAAVRWGLDGERYREDGERHLTYGENSQEEEKEEDQREKKKEKREKTHEKGDARGKNYNKDTDEKEALQAAWRHFNKSREEQGKPITREDMKTIQARLKNHNKLEQAKLLETAAEKGWMNVFPDEEAKNKSRQVNGVVKNLSRGMTL